MIGARAIPAEWRTVLWIALPVYLVATLYLLVASENVGRIGLIVANALYLALLGWLTIRVTRPLPAERVPPPQSRAVVRAQFAVVALIIVLTALDAVVDVPIWSAIGRWLFDLGESVLPVEWFGGPGNAVANPIQYFVIPLVLLLLLRAKPAELGLGRGHRVWQTCVVWLALPVVLMAVLLVAGSISVGTLLRRIVGNAFQNGFFEEFLFRGALQSRLQRLTSLPWALTVQALVFGLWHLRANVASMDGDVLAGLALCITSQAFTGFVFGVVYHRTRNLVAPSVAHVVTNVVGQSFG